VDLPISLIINYTMPDKPVMVAIPLAQRGEPRNARKGALVAQASLACERRLWLRGRVKNALCHLALRRGGAARMTFGNCQAPRYAKVWVRDRDNGCRGRGVIEWTARE